MASSNSNTPPVAIAPGDLPPDLIETIWTAQADPRPWTLATNSDPKSLDDIFVILAFTMT
ncbi:MAG TPA: hypothetical protein VE422_00850 [Terriglobia bacterium]|nr:hypothetical protein [Terriglobia bacterium]